ncbi:MAG: hypothetical protein LUH22_18965 [Bacteroides sp.]|nr:hypothetical protein [Bacteroides sp.]
MSEDKAKAIISRTITTFHESLIHGELFAKDYMDDGAFNYSNIPSSIKDYCNKYFSPPEKHYHHSTVYHNNDSQAWPNDAYKAIQRLNSQLKTGYTNSQIKKMIWSYSGGR